MLMWLGCEWYGLSREAPPMLWFSPAPCFPLPGGCGMARVSSTVVCLPLSDAVAALTHFVMTTACSCVVSTRTGTAA